MGWLEPGSWKDLFSRCSWLLAVAGLLLGVNASLAATSVSTPLGGNWNSTTTWLQSRVPGAGDNVEIFNDAVVTLDTDVSVNHLTVLGGATLNLASYTCTVLGAGVTNHGTIDGTATRRINLNPNPPPDIWQYFYSTLRFAGSTRQVYSGTGSIPAPLQVLEVSNPAGFSFDPAVKPVSVLSVYLTSGAITNAGRLLLGTGFTGPAVSVQVADGSFADPPAFNLGFAGEHVSYVTSSIKQVTGYEIQPGRILASLKIDNANLLTHQVTIAGGDLTVNGLSLLDGRIVTSDGNILVMAPGASVYRYPPAIGTTTVDGTMRKTLLASGAVTFEVGTASGHSPVTVNVTAGTFPIEITVGAQRGRLPTYYQSVNALKRYWTVRLSSDARGDLIFYYPGGDVFTRAASSFKLVQSVVSFGYTVLVLQNSSVDAGNRALHVSNLDNLGGSWFILGQPDSDLDGLPDSYEAAWSFNPYTPVSGTFANLLFPWDPKNPWADAHTDSDGDGFSNLQEFNLGTNPNNREDHLRIVSITRNEKPYATPNYLVRCSATDFKSYRLDYKNSLADPDWTFVRFSDAHTGQPTAPIPDVTIGTTTQRVYRVRFDADDQL